MYKAGASGAIGRRRPAGRGSEGRLIARVLARHAYSEAVRTFVDMLGLDFLDRNTGS